MLTAIACGGPAGCFRSGGVRDKKTGSIKRSRHTIPVANVLLPLLHKTPQKQQNYQAR
jgi:hypothetical protein